jgi:hypothetical protein
MVNTNSKSSITDVVDSQTLALIVDELLTASTPEMFLADLEEIFSLAVTSPDGDSLTHTDRSDLVLTSRKLLEFFRALDKHIKKDPAAA